MWIIFSILAAFLWSVVNIIDKQLMAKYISKPVIPVITSGFLSLIFGLIALGKNFILPSGWALLLSLLTGIITVGGSFFYFKATKEEEISRVVPLFSMTLIWTAILAFLFLKERLGTVEYTGILIVFLGSTLILSKKGLKLSINKVFLFMFLSTFFYAINKIIYKYLLHEIDSWTVFAYTCLGYFLAIIPLLIYYTPTILKHFKQKTGSEKKKAIFLTITTDTLNILAVMAFIMATSLGFISLVTALISIQYLFVFIWVIILSFYFSKAIKEKLNGQALFIKAMAIFLIVGGVMMII